MSMALSIAEAKYVVVSSYCAQLLWIKQQLKYIGVLTNIIPLLCDNTSVMIWIRTPFNIKGLSIYM